MFAVVPACPGVFPSDGVFMQRGGHAGATDRSWQAVHGALDELDAVGVSLDRPVPPRLLKLSEGRSLILT